MEHFTAITFELYLNNAWVDISADVLKNPAPRVESRGIMSNAPQQQLGSPSRLTFSLKNSTGNSGGLLGYYSPGHANCRAGWTTGLRVRLSFSYNGFTRYKWHGRIEPDGIKVISGIYGPRRVDVSCYDYMGQAAYHRLNQVTPQVNIDIDDALQLILDNMPIQPLAQNFTKTLASALPYLFDNLNIDTTGLSEMQKLTQNHAYSNIFVAGDDSGGETLWLAGSSGFSGLIPNITALNDLKLETGDFLLQEDGSSTIMLDETETITMSDADILSAEVSYGKYVYNLIEIDDYPRKIDAAATTILYTLQSAQQLAHGASVTFWGTYRDPNGGNTKVNGTSMAAMVSGTDYKAFQNADGTGTDYTASMSVTATFFAADAKFVVTNNHATDSFYFGGPSITFQCKGKGVYLYDPARVIASDTTSQTTYGIRPLKYDWRYAYTGVNTQTYADLRLAFYKDPALSIDSIGLCANKDQKNMYTFMFMEPRHSLAISESVSGLNKTCIVQGFNFEIREGTTVFWDFIAL